MCDEESGWDSLVFSDPSVTSHAIGRVIIINSACDIILGARAERKAVTDETGDHWVANLIQ